MTPRDALEQAMRRAGFREVTSAEAFSASAEEIAAALAAAGVYLVTEPMLTSALSEIAPVVGGDLLTGGVKHRIALAAAILAALSETNA